MRPFRSILRGLLLGLFVASALLWPTTMSRNYVSLPFVDRHVHGFDLYSRHGSYELVTGSSDLINNYYLPHWIVLIVSAGAWFALARPRRSAKAGHCPQCGYDLRASPERCPECGTDVRKSTQV